MPKDKETVSKHNCIHFGGEIKASCEVFLKNCKNSRALIRCFFKEHLYQEETDCLVDSAGMIPLP
jgi:hypothetical protein